MDKGCEIMGMLQNFQMKLRWNETMYMPEGIPTDIYHYTSPGGFESILFRNPLEIELWASRYDCLNDISEGSLAGEVYKEVCLEMKESKEITEEFYDLIKGVPPARTMLMWHTAEGKDNLTRPEYERYICSFSKNSDSLAMWSYYSKGNMYEGFNLGFLTHTLEESVKEHLQSYETMVHIYPVLYERVKQKELIHGFITKLAECYEEGDETSVRYMVSNQLVQWSLVFKNEYFKHEEEVRLIVDVGVKKWGTPSSIPQLKVNYRITKGFTIPYIKLQIDKYALSYVTIGPLLCDQKSKENQVVIMEDRLTLNNYSALVQYSEIPVRY